MEQVYEKGCTHKTIKVSKHLLPRRFKPKIGKSTYIEGKRFDCLLIISKIYFFVKTKCYKSKTNILGTLNVYKTSAKEQKKCPLNIKFLRKV